MHIRQGVRNVGHAVVAVGNRGAREEAAGLVDFPGQRGQRAEAARAQADVHCAVRKSFCFLSMLVTGVRGRVMRVEEKGGGKTQSAALCQLNGGSRGRRWWASDT